MSSATSLPTPNQWYDRHRRCEDGNSHEGKLELITWTSTASGDPMGWGNCLASESDELKEKFEKEFHSNEEKMYDYWPQGFRWTCCGTEGDQLFGCDHHGDGSTPCSCDFCKVGIFMRSRLSICSTRNKGHLLIRSGRWANQFRTPSIQCGPNLLLERG